MADDTQAPALPAPLLRSFLWVAILAAGGLILHRLTRAEPTVAPAPQTSPAAQPPSAQPPVSATAEPVKPVAKPAPADAKPIVYPDGTTYPTLNGVVAPPPIPWPQQVPFSPVTGVVVDKEGVSWYRHKDGSISTVRMAFRKDLGREDAYGMVILPTQPQPLVQDEQPLPGSRKN